MRYDTIRAERAERAERAQRAQRTQRGRGVFKSENNSMLQRGGLLFFLSLPSSETLSFTLCLWSCSRTTQCATGIPHDPVFFPLQKKEKVMVEQFDMYVCTCNIIGGREDSEDRWVDGWSFAALENSSALAYV